MTTKGSSSDRRLLTLEVARRHYLDGWTKKDIGERLALSRFQVARMLERARANGWVHIKVEEPTDLDAELGDRIREMFDLRYVLVTRGRGANTRALVAAAGAWLLEDALQPEDVLGLAWSRTVAMMVDRLSHVPRIPVVQLNGALPESEDTGGSVEMVRRFATTSGGPAYCYYAPMILPDASTARALRKQPEIARTLGMLPQVTTAVVAVGNWAAGWSTVYDALSLEDRTTVSRHDVVAEVSGMFVNSERQPVQFDVAERMLCPRAEDLRQVEHVLALTTGRERGAVLEAVLHSGLITSLVLDTPAAESLLEVAAAGGPIAR